MIRRGPGSGTRFAAMAILVAIGVAGCSPEPAIRPDPDFAKSLFSETDTRIPPRFADYGAYKGPSGYVKRREVGTVVITGVPTTYYFGTSGSQGPAPGIAGGPSGSAGSRAAPPFGSTGPAGSAGGRATPSPAPIGARACYVHPENGMFTGNANGTAC